MQKKSAAIDFVRQVCPNETAGWDKIALPLAGFLNAASNEDQYKSCSETVLILDAVRLYAQEDKEKFKRMLKSRTLNTALTQLKITDRDEVKAISSVLLVAGRTIDCIEHTRRALGSHPEKAEKPQTLPCLKRDYPWLQEIFSPTTMRTLDDWLDWVGKRFSQVADIQEFCEEFHLGTRYYMLWRALYAFDKDEQRKANDNAYWYANLIVEKGYSIVDRVLELIGGTGRPSKNQMRRVIEDLAKQERT